MPLLADCKKADALVDQRQMPEGACWYAGHVNPWLNWGQVVNKRNEKKKSIATCCAAQFLVELLKHLACWPLSFFPWRQQHALGRGRYIIIYQLCMCFRSLNTKVVITKGKCFPFGISYFWLIRHFSALLARACVEDEECFTRESGRKGCILGLANRRTTRKAQTQ